MLVFRVFTKRFLEFSDRGYQKNSAGGTVPMEVHRWEKERSGNPGFAVFRIICEELVQKIQMKGWGEKGIWQHGFPVQQTCELEKL